MTKLTNPSKRVAQPQKIKVTQFGVIHYIAGCDKCGFSEAIHTTNCPTPADVRSAARKHVLETGHECWIESGTHTRYSKLKRESK